MLLPLTAKISELTPRRFPTNLAIINFKFS